MERDAHGKGISFNFITLCFAGSPSGETSSFAPFVQYFPFQLRHSTCKTHDDLARSGGYGWSCHRETGAELEGHGIP